MHRSAQILLLIALMALGCACYGRFTDQHQIWQPAIMVTAIVTAMALIGIPSLKAYQFAAWVIVAFLAAMNYPQAFDKWGSFDMKSPAISLLVLQIVMFGMGTQMSMTDFFGLVRSPYAIFVGLMCQYFIMPLTGYALTMIFPIEPEIAAGVILIGCCSSGLASNVMTYIAKANVALSVTMTAMATLLAPIITPLWMKVLAGQLVPVDVTKMMMEIILMVIIPIFAAMLDDLIKHYGKKAYWFVVSGAVLGMIWVVLRQTWPEFMGQSSTTTQRILLESLNALSWSFIIGLAYHYVVKFAPQIGHWMPTLSMIGIVYIILIITVKGRNNLLHFGPLLFFIVMLHNLFGFWLGYWSSRMCGLDSKSCRTIAFEVGMQNGGMASGLAVTMGKVATVGLAPIIFATWMNISGSVLANYWSKIPPVPSEPRV
jgi:BASS family bile acid:Na+ symporter